MPGFGSVIVDWWNKEDDPVVEPTDQARNYSQSFRDKVDVWANYGLRLKTEMPNEGPNSEKIVNTALSLVGHDTIMNPTINEPEGRMSDVCVNAVCKIFRNAGYEEYLPRDPQTNLISGSNDFMIDNLQRSPDWESITYKDDDGRSHWDTSDISKGDWVIVNNEPGVSRSKHSMIVAGVTDSGYIIVDDPGVADEMRIKFHSKEWMDYHISGIFRLNPSKESMINDVLKDIEF